jgi:hypothetical protein
VLDNEHTEQQAPSTPINDPLDFLRNNIIHGKTRQLRHRFSGGDIGQEVAEFLATLEPRTRSVPQRSVFMPQKWPCHDPKVREVFLEFERRFTEIVEDLGLTQQQQDAVQLKAKCLVTPGGGFDDAVMCVLNYPTFNCGEKYHGSTYDLSNPCVEALSNALGGLHGVSTCSHNLT